MTACDNAAAVKDLLNEVEPEVLIEVLHNFWHSWLASDLNDCTTASTRLDHWEVYQQLLKFAGAVKFV